MDTKKEEKFASREEWLAWRHERFGASDAPMVMGRSQYGTREELIKDKAFPLVINSQPWLEETKGNGEREAVELYISTLVCREYAVDYQETYEVKIRGLKRKLSCTVDAVVEFYPMEGNFFYRYAIEVKCVDKASEGDGVPPRYYHQLLQQYMVMIKLKQMPDKIIYIEYDQKEKKILKCCAKSEGFHDEEENFSALISAYIRAEEEIEALQAKAVDGTTFGVAEGTKIRLYDLAEQYKAMLPAIEAKKAELDELEKESDKIRKQISSLVGDQEFKFEHQGIKVAKIKIKGAIDIDKLPLDLSIDECRKPPTYSVRITKEKPAKLPKGISTASGVMELK